MQLIKLTDYHTENRSQEISKITRELKILARQTETPIILLSQLNRNIENRVNKRPLLSDLRESGCLSYVNMPQIVTVNTKTYSSTQIIYCFNKFYKPDQENNLKLKNGKKQHIYLLANHKQLSLWLTHNHKILTSMGWKKEDQVKQKYSQGIGSNNYSNSKITIELSPFQQIKMLKKEKVYDIALYEYSNFFINKIIVHNSIEQDADLILMLYRNSEEASNNKIDIVIAKHRNGPIGSFRLIFYADTCQFSNVKSSNLIDTY